MLVMLALLMAAEVPRFPEQVPGMIEDCLIKAIANNEVTETEDSYKYICVGEPASKLWQYLERAKLKSWEQDTPEEGRWLSRSFPLGGCFKRTRMPDGSIATDGLSCSIWIPRPSSAPKSNS